MVHYYWNIQTIYYYYFFLIPHQTFVRTACLLILILDPFRLGRGRGEANNLNFRSTFNLH